MKKKFLKTICYIVVVFFITICLSSEVYALTDISANSYTDWTYNSTASAITTTQNVMATAIRVVQIVATGIAVIMILMVSIKYMSASPEGKAEYKKTATAYIVGAVIMFGVSNILAIISKFATSLK